MSPARRGLLVLVVCLVALAGCATAPDASGTTPEPTGPTASEPTASADSRTGAPTDDAGPVAANGTLELHFVNVGQSVATLVITPTGETMLIDSGDWRDDGAYVVDYLRRQGVDRIDHLVTSHADADHIGGHAAVIEHFETEGEGVGAVYDPGVPSSSRTYERYLDAVEAYDVPIYRTRAGARLPVDGVAVTVLGPPADLVAAGDRNENSIVLRVVHGETSVLFTGDAEAAAESYLVSEYGDRLDSTVYKTGHHGSRSSSSAALLDAVRPRVAVISSAYDSQYGHPHEEVLARLAERSVPTYWTAVHGDVVLRSDGTAVSVATQRPAPTAPRDLRSADAVDPGTDADVTLRETFDGSDPVAPATTTVPATTVAADGGGELSLVAVHADAEGDDNENRNDEYVVFENAGDGPLDLSGWQLGDAAGHRYEFPEGFTLASGDRVTVRTGSGTDSDTDLYWGQGSAVWNNDGDTVIVRDDDGSVVIEETY